MATEVPQLPQGKFKQVVDIDYSRNSKLLDLVKKTGKSKRELIENGIDLLYIQEFSTAPVKGKK